MITTNPAQLASEQVKAMVISAIHKAVEAGSLPKGDLPEFIVEVPGDTTHGDYATNVAMTGARTFRMAPPQIAKVIVEQLDFTDTYFTSASIAGPGFMNFVLDNNWFSHVVESVVALDEQWGNTDYGQRKKVMVEFVSANPTGPMHLGNARGGVVGDSLVAAMTAAGYDAHREFYLNDAGNQIEKFGLSLELRYLQQLQGEDSVEFPEECYQGADITERAKEYIDQFGDSLLEKTSPERQKIMVDFALPLNVTAMEKTLEKYGIVYDAWFRESTIHEDGTIDTILEVLKKNNMSYEKDGAIWYKATAAGEEKDEVLIRNNGNPTYFAADIAYHYNKFVVRGYEKSVEVWGADHHGHVARMKAAMNAIDVSGDRLDVILIQLVRLMKDGEPFRMSKRSGKSVTLDDLLELVPVDAARFYFNMRESGSAMDFDLDLAVSTTNENPVHYVKYAHARIHSILKKVAAEGIVVKEKCTEKELSLLVHPSEVELIRTLAGYPNMLIGTAVNYNTSTMTHYAIEVATAFHKFYTDCYVLGEKEELMQARIALCNATRITIYNLLGLLKITAPEQM